MDEPRREIFDAVRAKARPGLFNDPGNVLALDNLLDAFDVPRAAIERYQLHDAGAFFKQLRLICGSLDQLQVDSVNGILAAAEGHPIGWVAYELGTGWHEARLRPIDEIGKGHGRIYGKPGARMMELDNPPMYGGQIPYGRGLVQLTWADNYEWADKVASAAGLISQGRILADFDLVKRPDLAAFILVKGMETGAFTGKSLADYLPAQKPTRAQFTQARRIVNGTDRADLVATYALEMMTALQAGRWQ